MSFLKWLFPGMRIKRWLALSILGLLIMGIGLSLLIEVQVLGAFEREVLALTYQLLGPISQVFVSLIFLTFGFVFLIFGFRQMLKSLIDAVDPNSENKLVEIVYQKRHLNRGPKIVVIGGGTGIPVLLRGLKEFTTNITAIVTMADDGGSSGELKKLGILPPGDIRNCLIALADKETLMEEVLQYRFDSSKGLKGHNLGNLLIAAMSEVTGSFDAAIREMSKVLAIKGQVLPSTLDEIDLAAEMHDGEIVYGESKIPKQGKAIKRVFLKPVDPKVSEKNIKALPEAVKAIKEADAVILGPGSLFTSVIPNLLIPDIARALKESPAIKAYICNVMTQPGETDRFTASRHASEIIKHAGLGAIDYIIVNKGEIPWELQKKYLLEGSVPVKIDAKRIEKLGLKLIKSDILYKSGVARHDPEELAKTVLKLL